MMDARNLTSRQILVAACTQRVTVAPSTAAPLNFTLPETGAGREFTITPEIARGEKPLRPKKLPLRRAAADRDESPPADQKHPA